MRVVGRKSLRMSNYDFVRDAEALLIAQKSARKDRGRTIRKLANLLQGRERKIEFLLKNKLKIGMKQVQT